MHERGHHPCHILASGGQRRSHLSVAARGNHERCGNQHSGTRRGTTDCASGGCRWIRHQPTDVDGLCRRLSFRRGGHNHRHDCHKESVQNQRGKGDSGNRGGKGRLPAQAARGYVPPHKRPDFRPLHTQTAYDHQLQLRDFAHREARRQSEDSDKRRRA